jgi:hypothetical protein
VPHSDGCTLLEVLGVSILPSIFCLPISLTRWVNERMSSPTVSAFELPWDETAKEDWRELARLPEGKEGAGDVEGREAAGDWQEVGGKERNILS